MIEGLYLILDTDVPDLEQRLKAALRGGTRIVQYRDKNRPPEQQRQLAIQLRQLCHEAGALFIINDHPQLALDCEADGVHLGQGDLSVNKARQLLGPERLIGISTRTVEEALKAEALGADYIGLGSMYPTSSKDDAVLVGVERLRQVRKAVRIPIVAIGGITRDRAGELIDAGADSLAVISAVFHADDPALAAREFALQFNRRRPFPRGRVLSIAGSDSGGGAGIQADLKTTTLLGGYGACAITALTAQSTLGVRGIHPAPADFIVEQISAVLEDIGADTLKTGMLFSPEIVTAVADAIRQYTLPAVVDPVMVAKGGATLLEQAAVEAVRERLVPETYLLTPNLPEAETLCGLAVRNIDEMERAANRLHEMGARHVLVKGGHLEGDALDVLLADGEIHHLRAPRIDTRNTHGTGCTYATAIATFLAQGLPLREAVQAGKKFITRAIETTIPLGSGHGPVNHWQAAWDHHLELRP